jgi:LacI family transcriptional regulator
MIGNDSKVGIGLRDIAEKAAVSVPTVSRVLRNTADALVTDQTRQRIIQVAEELGYHPNRHAQALSGGKASLIHVIVAHTSAHITSVKIWNLQRWLGELGRDVITTDVATAGSPESVRAMLLSGAPEAVVFLMSDWDAATLAGLCTDLYAEGTSILAVDYTRERLPPDVPCDTVTVHRALGAYLAVSHLVESGHRCIGLLTPEGVTPRLAGYERALAERGIADRFVASFEHGQPALAEYALCAQRAARGLLERNPQVTALFCHSDLTAAAAMRGLQDMGLQIPRDVAIVGFDNDPWTPYLPVSLSTVAQPVDELCEVATRLLSERLEGQTGAWRRTWVNPSLIVRESSANSGPAGGRR